MKTHSLLTWGAGLALLLPPVWVRAAEQPWQELASLPEPNGGFVCGALPGALIVVGGTNWVEGQKQWLREVYRLDLAALRWSSLGSLEQPLAYALGGVSGGGFIIAGGTTGKAAFPGTVRIAGGKVTRGPTLGFAVPAVFSAGGQIGDELIHVGGTDDAVNAQGFRRDAFAWNMHSGAGRTLPPYPGSAFGLAASVVAGGELFVFGGARWDAPTRSVVNLTEAYAFSPQRNSWRHLNPLPFAVRGLAAVALDGRHLYLAGGYKNDAEGFTDRGFVYDIGEDHYRSTTSLPYRAIVGLVKSGEFVYCLGGEDKQQHRSAAVYRTKAATLSPAPGSAEK